MQGITYVEVDFNDGAGFRGLYKGNTVNIYYATEGLKYITAKIYTANGIRTAKSVIDYKRPVGYSEPDYTWNIEVDPVYTDDNQYLNGGGQTLDGPVIPCSGGSFIDQLLCSLKPNAIIQVENGCDRVFDKPIIIVEGFDPTGDLDINEMQRRFDAHDFRTTMKAYGYDFVYVDFTKNTTYIENNAKVLEAVINKVNQTKVGSFKSTVIGFSMGGLIARWCLKDMEDRGLQHQVENYFSYDAPQQGANIPLGMQYIFKELVRDLPYLRWISDLRKLDDAFKSPAGRQMLVTYGSYNNGPFNWFPNLNTLDPLRSAFAQQLQLKGYPQQTRNFGIAFGRGDNTVSTKDAGNGNQFTAAYPFAPQSEIFNGAMAFFLVNAEAIAKAVPENNIKATIAYYSFFGITFRKIFGIPFPTVTLRVRRFDYRGQFPYDDAMGSFETTQSQFKESWVGGISGPATTNGHDGHNFVSTASALDLQNQGYGSANSWQSNNMFFNIDNLVQNAGQVNGNTLSNPALSPFQAVITSTTEVPWYDWNIYHNGDIASQFADFIERNILNAQPVGCGGSNNLCNNNPTISGPDMICGTTATYTISDFPNGVVVNWSLQNSTAIISAGQGTKTITVTKQAIGTNQLSVTLTNSCTNVTLTKAIQLGLNTPTFSIYAPDGYCIGNRYEAIANANNSGPGISYNWYINGVLNSFHGYKLRGTFLTNSTRIELAVVKSGCGTSLKYKEDFDCSGGWFVISPNPSTSNLKVESISETSIREIRIIDKMGNVKFISRHAGNTKIVSLNVSLLLTDIYNIQVFDGNTWSGKLLSIRR